jgi:uncharacterized membrane protein
MTLLTRLALLPIVVLGAASAGWVLQFFWGASDGIRTRSSKTTKRLVLAGLLFAGVGLWVGYLGRHSIIRQYDAARLATFARTIADADQVVATCWEDKSVRLAFTGDDAKRVVGAVTSGVSARLPDGEFAAAYDVVATFYRGTNTLGQIKLCAPLFLLESNDSPFLSQTLETRVYRPVLEALHETYAHQRK